VKRTQLSPVTSLVVSLSLVVGIRVGNFDQRVDRNPVDSPPRGRRTPRRKRRGILRYNSKYEPWLLLVEALLLSMNIALEVHKLLS
jgi:hypothetical protein